MLSFEQYLVDQGLVSELEIEKARRLHNDAEEHDFLSALRKTVLPANEIAQAISAYHNIPLVQPDEWPQVCPFLDKISPSFLRESKVFPLFEGDDGVFLAMADPGDDYAIDAVRLATGRPVIPRVAVLEEIESAIERTNRHDESSDAWIDEADGEDHSAEVEHLRDMALGTPIVQFVNALIQDAIHSRATDIHIEPFKGRVAVRMRVDGMLKEVSAPPATMARAIVSRIKILSGLNIAERRLPQDGRARIKIGSRRLDLRVATMPTIHGESVSIRLLDNVRRVLDFSKLGFCDRDEAVILRHLSAPYGLLLVTGPTGSGKTTTLATALTLLNQSNRKILTIEDPIEYEIEGVNQTQAKPAIGLTFAAAMRSFLRHDPDVMMVGEMRDGETASMGVHAALTGHLVLSTLHTNTAAGAIPRLLDMGIDAFLLASSLRCVIAQRLVRVLCPHCKSTYEGIPSLPFPRSANGRHDEQSAMRLWRAVGCERCFGTGYNDRTVITEVLDVNEDIRNLIKPGIPTPQIDAAAREQGMTTMMTDGLRKCGEGMTTPEEVGRVAAEV